MDTKAVTVGAFLTAPRYELVWSRNCIGNALAEMQIPLAVSGGVFYGQNMQRMLEDAVAKGIQFALTIDGDSAFTSQHVKDLLSAIVSDDGIDAIAAMQCRRGMPFPIMTVADAVVNGECEHGATSMFAVDGSPIRVRTAHFGLTLIRLDRLKDVPKPWFWSKPDANGQWANDKLDDDIYFWKNWEKAGRTVYVDPQVRIGHVEEIVVTFDENLQPRHSYPADWWAHHFPDTQLANR